MKRRWVILACAAVIVSSGAIAYYRISGTIPVDVYRVRIGRVEEITAAVAAGTVKSSLEAVLSTETGGQVSEVLVREGSTARRGDVLARIVDPELVRQGEASLAEEGQARDVLLQAEAKRQEAVLRIRAERGRAGNNLRKAHEDHRRSEELFRDGFVSRSDLEAAATLLGNAEEEARIAAAGESTLKALDREIDVLRGRIEAARARTAAVTARRSKLTITAPFSGVITKKTCEIGETKLPGGVLLTLADPSSSYVEAQIDEADAAKVRVGQTARLLPEAFRGEKFTGRVSEVRPTVEASKEVSRANTIAITLTSAPQPLRLGMSVDVEVLTGGKDNVPMVPSAALMERDAKKFVYVVSGGKAVRRDVTVGVSNWDRTEILTGVSPGEDVVTSLEIKDFAPGSRVGIRSRQ
ncbi:MAG: efflux RND transporter periplasmic adaptor subunit [Deltaproteobacteria bacterium]|nr:efflux RND transporter periplasmic adaptor subunit [Deltaproteobacteria bacterium]